MNPFFTSSNTSKEDIDKVLCTVLPCVSEEINFDLLREFTHEERINTVKQMHPTKALGIDGMHALFYPKFWHLVGRKMSDACLQILNHRGSIIEWNSIVILLIPKVKEPIQITKFRLISLYNVVYRLVTKVIGRDGKIIR